MNEKKQIQVWDPLVRIFHWLLAVCFAIAYLLEDDRLKLHLLAGSTVLGLVVFRLIWGVIGTRHSRFAGFTCSPGKVKEHLSDLARLKPAYHLGHTPAGSAMIVLLLAGLLILSLSGTMLYGLENSSFFLAGMVAGIELDMVIMLENLHELTADILTAMVLLHVAGVLVESALQGQNLIRSMVTGFKTEKRENI